MMRTSLSTIALLVVSCAYHPPRGSLTPLTRIGPAEDFGLRITEVAGLDIDYIIDRPAYVVAIRVRDPSDLELVSPVYGHGKLQPGHHYLRAGETRDLRVGETREQWVEVSYGGTEAGLIGCYSDGRSCDYLVSYAHWEPVPESAPLRSGYWLLIVSDVPSTAAEIIRRARQIEGSEKSVVNLVRRIPQALIASRTAHWAAYYAAFGQQGP